ncbi:MAG: SusC/RagA family TonB-linked outer membrane protein, partial [Tannerellaceae bacterium]|nr:SusC/RagA family TonB-linked outer membrane protein [Tannerellaceae bacterium]
MKLTLFALLLGISAVFASSANSQTARVNIEANDIQAKEIIQQIEQQTDYLFVYNHANVDLSQKVSMQTTDTPVAEILTTLFATSDILYAMEGNNILLMKRNERLQTQQNRKTVNGIVTDQWGEPLMGVSVSKKESAYGTITDIDGHYSMEVENENTILVFSFIGFNTKEQVVGNRSHLNITLEENIQEIDEVVVIGYGTVKKSDLTGAVSHIKSEELLKRPTVDVSQALQGKFAGVDVTQNSGIPGGEVRIRVRGDNSISSSSDPLWVVDGIVGIWNSANINPNDIETIEILKDASATAIYGARGANGVIMVTTKRGISGKPIVNYDGYLSVAKLSNKVDLLNASEFMQIYNQSFDNAAKYDPEGYAAGKYKRNMPENYPDLFHADGTPSYDTDWQDEVYRTAVGQNHQFSVRGGSDKVRYGTFLGVTLQPGIMDRSDYKRYTGKVTLDNDLTDWLTLSSFVSVNYTRKNMSREDLGVSRLTMEALPILPVQFEDGRYSTQTDFLGWEQENPVKRLYQTEDVKDIYQTMASIAANIKFTKDLTLNTSFSVDLGSSKENYYSGRDLNLISASQNGIAEITSRRELYWQNENYLTYDKYFNNIHHLTVMAGLSWQERYWERAVSKSENFIDDFYQWHNLGVGTVLKTPESEDERWRINSYFSRINYVIAEKYLFTLTGRVDGSSKFGKNNKYAFFPSAAVAWRISQEEFLKENDWISNLKLRTSVGITGNQEIGIYKSLQLLETGQVILGDQYQTGLYKGTFGNRDLKWEKTTQYDVGLDLGLFNQRINLTADYYHKTTRDLLLETPLPYSSGMDKVMTNIGSLRNT